MDNFMKSTWVFLMQCKSDTQFLLQSFYFYVESQFNKRIKIIYFDKKLEHDMLDSYQIKGIIH